MERREKMIKKWNTRVNAYNSKTIRVNRLEQLILEYAVRRLLQSECLDDNFPKDIDLTYFYNRLIMKIEGRDKKK